MFSRTLRLLKFSVRNNSQSPLKSQWLQDQLHLWREQCIIKKQKQAGQTPAVSEKSLAFFNVA